jgi:membrane-bound lytic murein transglycosylase D
MDIRTPRFFGILLLLFLPQGSAGFATSTEASFRLTQIAEQFPSRGFEVEIDFWKRVFTEYSETQVIFHDRRDLRIAYEVVEFKQGIREDEDEAERQRGLLEKKEKELQRSLLELSRGKPDSEWEHALAEHLRKLGVTPTPQLYRSLSRTVRYQRGLREPFGEGLSRSGRYLQPVIEILREEGVPEELAALPHVESAFQWWAVSKAGAVGLWQFVKGTARSYLTVNQYLDQRLDPLESTRAAARLLKDNHEALGTWPLAITAYNYGRSGMMRAKRRHGDDMRTISLNYRARRFGFASRNFYPEFLAALEIMMNRHIYFENLEISPVQDYESLRLDDSFPVSVLENVDGLGRATLREYNPSLTSRVWKEGVLPAGIELRLPPGTVTPIRKALSQAKPVPASFEMAGDGTIVYRVRRGDTVGRIAARFGTSISTIRHANGLRDANRIFPGQRLRIP